MKHTRSIGQRLLALQIPLTCQGARSTPPRVAVLKRSGPSLQANHRHRSSGSYDNQGRDPAHHKASGPPLTPLARSNDYCVDLVRPTDSSTPLLHALVRPSQETKTEECQNRHQTL
ncbi:hypothetical protein V6N11_029774 [Hibiscus sabdariffa]|uniref:Uncharacterized protein n=1 Tax=Hibiscus sabdariffa TaxID=183260 RepID=A0ABR1ZPH3_9ROSI